MKTLIIVLVNMDSGESEVVSRFLLEHSRSRRHFNEDFDRHASDTEPEQD